MAGSEEDGHGYDPRYAEGWKPYVVFPCGCVPVGSKLVVSFGVNDWQCGVARLDRSKIVMVPADGTGRRKFYFRAANGALPIKTVSPEGQVLWLRWDSPPTQQVNRMITPGYLSTSNGLEAEELSQIPNVTETSEDEYHRSMMRRGN